MSLELERWSQLGDPIIIILVVATNMGLLARRDMKAMPKACQPGVMLPGIAWDCYPGLPWPFLVSYSLPLYFWDGKL